MQTGFALFRIWYRRKNGKLIRNWIEIQDTGLKLYRRVTVSQVLILSQQQFLHL